MIGPTDDDLQVVLDCIREHETRYKDQSYYFRFNPFNRPGITAGTIAIVLGWETGKVTKTGRLVFDTARAKRTVAVLVERGQLVSQGKHRTLSQGSKYLETYCTPSFMDWLRTDAARADKDGEA